MEVTSGSLTSDNDINDKVHTSVRRMKQKIVKLMILLVKRVAVRLD